MDYLANTLTKLNISTHNSDGTFKSFNELMRELNSVWNRSLVKNINRRLN
jgi:hypothetical protein